MAIAIAVGNSFTEASGVYLLFLFVFFFLPVINIDYLQKPIKHGPPVTVNSGKGLLVFFKIHLLLIKCEQLNLAEV